MAALKLLVTAFVVAAVVEVHCVDDALREPIELAEIGPVSLGETDGDHIGEADHAADKEALQATTKATEAAKAAASAKAGRRAGGGRPPRLMRKKTRGRSMTTSTSFFFGRAPHQGNHEEGQERAELTDDADAMIQVEETSRAARQCESDRAKLLSIAQRTVRDLQRTGQAGARTEEGLGRRDLHRLLAPAGPTGAHELKEAEATMEGQGSPGIIAAAIEASKGAKEAGQALTQFLARDNAKLKDEVSRLMAEVKRLKRPYASNGNGARSLTCALDKKAVRKSSPRINEGTPWFNTTSESWNCVGWNEESGARCGLTLKQQAEIAQSLQCPAEIDGDPVGIQRADGACPECKTLDLHVIRTFFDFGQELAKLFSISETRLPSEQCCGNFQSIFSGWTDKALAQCCGKMPFTSNATLCGGEHALKRGRSKVKSLRDVPSQYTANVKGKGGKKSAAQFAGDNVWRQGQIFWQDHAAYNPIGAKYSTDCERSSCLPLWPASGTAGWKKKQFQWKCSGVVNTSNIERQQGGVVCNKSDEHSQTGKRCLPRDPPLEMDEEYWPKVFKLSQEIDEENRNEDKALCSPNGQGQKKPHRRQGKRLKKRLKTSELGASLSLHKTTKMFDKQNFQKALRSALQDVCENRHGPRGLLKHTGLADIDLGEDDATFGVLRRRRQNRRRKRRMGSQMKKMGSRMKRTMSSVIDPVTKATNFVMKWVPQTGRALFKGVLTQMIKGSGGFVDRIKAALKSPEVLNNAAELMVRFIPESIRNIGREGRNRLDWSKSRDESWRKMVQRILNKMIDGDFKGVLKIPEVLRKLAQLMVRLIPESIRNIGREGRNRLDRRKSWRKTVQRILNKIIDGDFKGVLKNPAVLRKLAQLIEGLLPPRIRDCAPYLGYRKKHVTERYLEKVVPKLVDRKFYFKPHSITELDVVIYKLSKDLAIKYLKVNAASADAWGKLWYKVLPSLTSSKGKSSLKEEFKAHLALRYRLFVDEFRPRLKTFVFEPLFQWFGANYMWFECRLRKYALALLSTDYLTTVSPLNFHDRGKSQNHRVPTTEGSDAAKKLCKGEDCDGKWADYAFTKSIQNETRYSHKGGERVVYKPANMRNLCNTTAKTSDPDQCEEMAARCQKNRPDQGPFKLIVTRSLVTNIKKETERKDFQEKQFESLDVCQFEVSFDSFRCNKAWKYCGRKHKNKQDRDEPWSQNLKVIDSSNYIPEEQPGSPNVKGHNCRKWFVIVRQIISSLVKVMNAVRLVGFTTGLKYCHGYQDTGFYGPGYDSPANRPAKPNGKC